MVTCLLEQDFGRTRTVDFNSKPCISDTQLAVNNVFTLNLDSREWKEGPPMKEARKIHTCNLVETGSGAKKIVVVGGSGTGAIPIDSVEIFDLSSNEWLEGEIIFHLCIAMLNLIETNLTICFRKRFSRANRVPQCCQARGILHHFWRLWFQRRI